MRDRHPRIRAFTLLNFPEGTLFNGVTFRYTTAAFTLPACRQAGLLKPWALLRGANLPEDWALYAISKLMGPNLKPFGQEFMDAIYGLIAYRLIDDTFVFGEAKHVSERFPHINDSGLVAGPTQVGTQLFLWALAAESRNPRYIFSIPTTAFPDVDIIVHGCMAAIWRN